MTTLRAAAVLGLLAGGPAAMAQPYEVPWWTIDGGGGTSSGGIYTLSGTIGQPDAGAAMSGGIYSLSGGFWAGAGGPAGCPADFNGDGFVDFFDFDDFVSCFEGIVCPPGKSADFNNDGFADFFDYDDFIAAFEAGCP